MTKTSRRPLRLKLMLIPDAIALVLKAVASESDRARWYYFYRGKENLSVLGDFLLVRHLIDVATERRSLAAKGAILTDAWIPGAEENYRDRLDGLVIDEIVSLLVAPGTFTFGFFPVFIEGLDGQNPTLETESNVLPERYVSD